METPSDQFVIAAGTNTAIFGLLHNSVMQLIDKGWAMSSEH